MSFFYDLNKRLAALADKQDLHESRVAESEKWIQKAVNPKNKGNLHKALHVAQDKTIPKAKIEKATHSKNPKLRHMAQFAKNVANEEMADEGNAFTGKLASTPKGGSFKLGDKEFKDTSSIEEGTCPSCNCAPCKCDESMDESALQAYLGKKKYGDKGMKALQQAGREHAGKAKMDQIRNRYDKMDEGDMEEGNAFTAALAKTPKGEKFKVGNKEFTDTSDLEEGFQEMDAWLAQREKEKGTGKFDKKERTLPGGMKATTYSRREEEPESDDDEEITTITIKKKGRPKSAAPKDSERVTKRSHKYKTVDGKRVKKEKTDENLDSDGVMMTRPTNCSSESIDRDMEGSHDRDEAGEYGAEGDYVKNELHTMIRVARDLEKHLRDNEDLPTWCIGKLSQAKGMVVSVMDYIISEKERGAEAETGEEGITLEKAPPGAKAERMVKGIKKSLSKDGHVSDKDKAIAYATTWKAHNQGKVEEESTNKEDQRAEKAGKRVAKDIEYDEHHKGKDDNQAEKAGKRVTKDIEYDDKKDRKEKKTESAKPDFLDVDKDGDKKEPFKKAVKDKEEKVDETTVAGSVAPVANAAPKGKGGMQFGKGVYESFNSSVEKMITESINVADTIAEDEGKTITVTASGPEADMLMQLLKAAGLSGQSQSCPTCGQSACGCEAVDEAYGDTDETLNNPDWPTDKETLAAEPNLRTYSGGLNGPKSTGQTTIPVVASQLRRQVSMEENVELERSLFKTWKNYKG